MASQITAEEARALGEEVRTADISDIYTDITTAATAGNVSLMVDEVLNYDIKTKLESIGYTITNPTATTTLISWAA